MNELQKIKLASIGIVVLSIVAIFLIVALVIIKIKQLI